MADITILVAFFAGIASFLSPCIFPLVPAFLTYISGVTADKAQKDPIRAKREIITNTLFFIFGFSMVFAILGAFITLIPYDLKMLFSKIGGIIIICFGLYLLGAFKIPFLEQEHRIHLKKFANTYLTSFLFGASFAAGWSPCVGAVLGSVLTLAFANSAAALPLLFAFSLGIMLPFLIAGIFFSQIAGVIRKYSHFLKYFNLIMGAFLIILGLLVLTDNLVRISNLFVPDFFFGFG